MSYRHNGGPAIDVPEGFDKLGWVAIHRAIRDHWLVGYGKPVAPADPSRGAHSQHEAFGDLIMECRYQAGYVTNGGRKMRIEPGQLLGGIAWLANRWNWTSKKVRWFLDKLEEDGMISRSTADQKGLPHGAFKGNQKMMITLCNYGAYQFSDKQFLTPQATDDASEAVEVTDNSSSCDSNKGNRGATKRATKRATNGATNVVEQAIENTEQSTSCDSNKGNQQGNQKGNQKGNYLNKYNKDNTLTRAHTRTREAPCLEDQKPQAQIVEDGWFYGEAIELDPEEHANWRAQFSALEGTWPAPLMSADHFLAVEFDRQGVKDPRSRKVRVMAYLAKRNTEAAMLQAQVTATAIVKPTPYVGGNGYGRKPSGRQALINALNMAMPEETKQ
jgi:hypothetical protein